MEQQEVGSASATRASLDEAGFLDVRVRPVFILTKVRVSRPIERFLAAAEHLPGVAALLLRRKCLVVRKGER